MAWQAPKTDWSAGEVVGDGDLNRIEGNLLESAVAKVSAPGDLVYATGPNALERLPAGPIGALLVMSATVPYWGYLQPDEYLIAWGW